MDRLTSLLKKEGRLSTSIIANDPHSPGVSAIVTRFKSLKAVYELLGYKQRRDVKGVVERQKERGRKHGFHCLGEALLSAVASGRLEVNFTIGALRIACPGWSHLTYSATCSQYATRSEARPVKLQRIGRGEYLIIDSQPNMRFPMVALDDCQVLERLAMLLGRRGRLSTTIIDEDRNTPSAQAIKQRFGSIRAAYELLGYSRKTDYTGVRKRFQERKKARGPGTMGEAMCDAIQSGRLAETFTVAEMKVVCPGWAYDSYYTTPAFYSRSDGATPIKLQRIGRGEYRVLHMGI